ncbi:MAG: SpoIIE family protein phosphatase [Oscillospiraceae bacterium]|nr:SpoIIE family protein phosphatase [Oscillospiraceae bacterium]
MVVAKEFWKSERRRTVAVCAAHVVMTAILSAGKIGGLYGVWALAAVAVSGGRGRGFWSTVGALLGAYIFYDFQSGLRLAASAVLIYCANMAFYDVKISRSRGFAPTLTAVCLLLVQSVYLVGRTARHWAVCFVAVAVAIVSAMLLSREGKDHSLRVLCVMLAIVCAATPLNVEGFSPGRAAAAWLVMLCSGAASPVTAAAIGAGIGLVVDVSAVKPTLLFTAAYACGGTCAALLRRYPRWFCGGTLCLCVMLTVLMLESDHGMVMVYEALCGVVAYAVVPRRWLPLSTAASAPPTGEREGTGAAVPAMASAVLREGAEAYRALYDELLCTATPQVENPSVIFDHAAEEVCRGCVLAQRCWQTEYDVTYSAFNDAVGPMLRRGRVTAEDFPLHFSSRCVHFSDLLAAIDRGVYAYLLRRQYRMRLGSVQSLAREQYAQMGQTLSAAVPSEGELRLRCRIGTSLRAKDGERVCGDQLAVFTVGNMLYMLLSDGMGSGEAAHAESAMTVRLLRKFLKAGIEAKSALKTLNTALTLRCAENCGFTTIDLLALDRSSGEATLYKYGAAPSYIRRGETVQSVTAGSLPAGLQESRAEPEFSRFALQEGDVFVMVSDGVVGSDGENWLPELLKNWSETDAQVLSQQILAESRRHGGLRDDCAALVAYLEKTSEDGTKRV